MGIDELKNILSTAGFIGLVMSVLFVLIGIYRSIKARGVSANNNYLTSLVFFAVGVFCLILARIGLKNV